MACFHAVDPSLSLGPAGFAGTENKESSCEPSYELSSKVFVNSTFDPCGEERDVAAKLQVGALPSLFPGWLARLSYASPRGASWAPPLNVRWLSSEARAPIVMQAARLRHEAAEHERALLASELATTQTRLQDALVSPRHPTNMHGRRARVPPPPFAAPSSVLFCRPAPLTSSCSCCIAGGAGGRAGRAVCAAPPGPGATGPAGSGPGRAAWQRFQQPTMQHPGTAGLALQATAAA